MARGASVAEHDFKVHREPPHPDGHAQLLQWKCEGCGRTSHNPSKTRAEGPCPEDRIWTVADEVSVHIYEDLLSRGAWQPDGSETFEEMLGRWSVWIDEYRSESKRAQERSHPPHDQPRHDTTH